MPKEYINNRIYGEDAEELDTFGKPTGNLVAIDDSAVKVGWTKDLGHVEIAVAHDRDGAGGEDAEWHAQMDRNGLNRLIRTLRKARDQAFGADA